MKEDLEDCGACTCRAQRLSYRPAGLNRDQRPDDRKPKAKVTTRAKKAEAVKGIPLKTGKVVKPYTRKAPTRLGCCGEAKGFGYTQARQLSRATRPRQARE